MLKVHISYTYLMNLGQHLGHSILNTLISNSWYIYCYRKQLTLMNLIKACIMYKVAFALFKGAAGRKGTVWFVNLDRHLSGLVIKSAKRSGEFYVTDFWVRGLVSNFTSMKNLYFKLMHTNPLSWTRMERGAGTVFSNWDFTRARRAGLVFISNLRFGRFAAKECIQSCLPSIGIADSDVPSFTVGVPIPGNDESLVCMAFYHDIAVGQILIAKFQRASTWFLGVRSRSRRVSFLDWVFNNHELVKSLDIKDYRFDLEDGTEHSTKMLRLLSEPMFVHSNVFKRGISAMVSNNYRLKSFSQDFEIFQPDHFFMDLDDIFYNYFTLERRFVGISNVYAIHGILQSKNMFFWRKMSFFRRFFKKAVRLLNLETFGWLRSKFFYSNFKKYSIVTKLRYRSALVFGYRYHLKGLNLDRAFITDPILTRRDDPIPAHFMAYYMAIFLSTKFSTTVKFNKNKSRILLYIDKTYSFLDYLFTKLCVTFDQKLWQHNELYPKSLYQPISLCTIFSYDFIFKWLYFNNLDVNFNYFFVKDIIKKLYFKLSNLLHHEWYYAFFIQWEANYRPYRSFRDKSRLMRVPFYRRTAYFMDYSDNFSNNFLSLYNFSSVYLSINILTAGYDAQYDYAKQDYLDSLTRYSYYATRTSFYA